MGTLVVVSLILGAQPAPSSEPAVLVRRLGDETFAVREEAAAALLKLGPAAREALRQGLTDSDPEVRAGCRRLLAQVGKKDRDARVRQFLDDPDKVRPPLAGWLRFRALAGTEPPARKRFAEIYSAEEPLLEALARDPKSAAATVSRRIAGLRLVLVTPHKDATVLREVTTLLFLAAEGQVPLDAGVHGQLCAALNILAERTALVKQARADPLLCKLLRTYLSERHGPVALNQALGSALALELPGTLDWAVRTALARDRPAPARGLAAILAGKVGGKEAVHRLEPLLRDTTPVGTFKLGTTTLHTELRDVVLAVLVQASGQKIEPYGFAYLQAVPGLKTLPTPERLGFAAAAARTAAFKRWQDTSAARQK